MVTHHFIFYLLKKHLNHSITKNQKILWINASNNGFPSLSIYILPQNAIFPLNFQIKILSLECWWPPIVLCFYLEGHITRKFSVKNKKNKNSMDWKLDRPSTFKSKYNLLTSRISNSVASYTLFLRKKNDIKLKFITDFLLQQC